VRFLDNRVLTLDTDPCQVLSAERRPVFIDTYTRWQITDPLAFYETLQTLGQARDRLTTLTTSNLLDVVGDREFQALLSPERAEIMAEIQSDVNAQVSRLGIRVVDVRILRAELPDQIAQTVYERMRTERQAEAQETRSRGRAAANRIQSAADRDRTVTLANARRDSEIIRGEGDAQRNRIFAQAYGQDPDFFAFYRAMRAYENSLNSEDTRLVISPDSEFFSYFNNPDGEQ
jgi:membrane protease subunit HflC